MTFTTETTYLGQKVRVQVSIENDGGAEVRSEARARILGIISNESERIAMIAAVDVQDQPIDAAEAKRIAGLPKDRPAIVLAAGSKDPATAVVERGTWQVGKDKRRLSAPKGER